MEPAAPRRQSTHPEGACQWSFGDGIGSTTIWTKTRHAFHPLGDLRVRGYAAKVLLGRLVDEHELGLGIGHYQTRAHAVVHGEQGEQQPAVLL